MALNKKNIIIGAARVYLGPSHSESDATGSKPDFETGKRYSKTMEGANGSTAGAGDASVVTAWNEVGYTQDGLELATDPSYAEVEVDQLLDAAKIFKDGMSMNVSTTFAEATLENLLIAWGQQTSSLISSGNGIDGQSIESGDKELVLEGGNLGEAPFERGLIAVGNAPELDTGNAYGERVYQLFRVQSVEATTLGNSRAEAATIPVTFRALPADSGRYGSIRDRMNIA